MKKLFTGLLLTVSLSTFAGWKEATLECSQGDEHLISIDVKSESIDDMRSATLLSYLHGLKARVSHYAPDFEHASEYGIFALALNTDVISELDYTDEDEDYERIEDTMSKLPLADYQVLKYDQSNMVMTGNKLINIGLYDLGAGVLKVTPYGSASITVDIDTEQTVYYRQYNQSTPSVIDEAAIATIEYKNGKKHSVPCRFKFFGE